MTIDLIQCKLKWHFWQKKRNKNQAMVEAQNYNSTFKQRVVQSDIDFGVLSSLDLCSVQRYIMSLWKNHNIYFFSFNLALNWFLCFLRPLTNRNWAILYQFNFERDIFIQGHAANILLLWSMRFRKKPSRFLDLRIQMWFHSSSLKTP